MAIKADIGLIGLAVMGKNLVLNMERNGFKVAVYNRTLSKVDNFIDEEATSKNIVGCYSVEELCSALKSPKKIMLMVKAGEAVDSFIEQLLPFLHSGDIIIDGGNSYYKDTIKRTEYLESKNIQFMGTGISGGEEGALNGPSIMPGGSYKAWTNIKDIFQSIAAKSNDGSPCCEWIGLDGAGHFVKMVHNGIEYGDMQLICEAYSLLKNILGLTNDELSQIFETWNNGELESYLIEITGNILKKKDKSGKHVVDIILDRAGQKGTGMWTSQAGLEFGVAIPTIAEAVFARNLSAVKDERIIASKILTGPEIEYIGDKQVFIESVRKALYASKICSYAQGYQLMKAANDEFNWNLNFGQIALIWREGCIIKAKFLDRIKEAFESDSKLPNLLLDPFFKNIINDCQQGWRDVAALASKYGVPIPAFSSALSYYDGYRASVLPANLLQAQRDYFGAHTYERIDYPRGEFFHSDWNGKK